MKKLWVVLVLFLIIGVSQASAATLRFTKVVDTADYTVTGYNMYWGLADGSYMGHRDIGNVDFVENLKTVCGLIGETRYYFAVSAYTADNEGLVSESTNYVTKVGYTPPPDTVIVVPVRPPQVVVTITVDVNVAEEEEEEVTE